jgi:hypothetical protein
MKYKQTFKEALKQVREDGHTDVASAVRQCKTTMEDASQMLSKLQGMNPEGALPSWWMNKIAIAADNMNKLRDYLLVPSTNEQKEEPEEDNKVADLKTKLSKEKDTDALEKQIVVLQGQINLLKVSLENEKNKTVKPEPNPETGEVPLRTGVAAAILDKNSPKKPKLQTQSTKKLKMSLGKSKIEVNPDVAMGVYSGGSKAPDGKLY